MFAEKQFAKENSNTCLKEFAKEFYKQYREINFSLIKMYSGYLGIIISFVTKGKNIKITEKYIDEKLSEI